MKKNCPKNFVKYASSPTREGIEKQIVKFYCGSSLPIFTQKDGYFELSTVEKGNVLSTVVIETTRGFYFGYFE